MHRWVGYDSAPLLAAELLGQATDRYRHTVGVATTAAGITRAVPVADAQILVAAAWLHDIGYAPPLVDTGFHPLDGARYLLRIGAPDRVARLVAHHTMSPIEAEARGVLAELLAEFPREESATLDALTYADLTTGPDGSALAAVERLVEILLRYPPDHVVHQSIDKAQRELLATAERVTERMSWNWGPQVDRTEAQPDAQ